MALGAAGIRAFAAFQAAGAAVRPHRASDVRDRPRSPQKREGLAFKDAGRAFRLARASVCCRPAVRAAGGAVGGKNRARARCLSDFVAQNAVYGCDDKRHIQLPDAERLQFPRASEQQLGAAGARARADGLQLGDVRRGLCLRRVPVPVFARPPRAAAGRRDCDGADLRVRADDARALSVPRDRAAGARLHPVHGSQAAVGAARRDADAVFEHHAGASGRHGFQIRVPWTPERRRAASEHSHFRRKRADGAVPCLHRVLDSGAEA